ncbi:hypothetical protein Tco_1282898 [Tanacetum coccineum]
MPPKRTSTSAALAMTQAAIRQLVTNSVATALEAQTTNMANIDNTNRNTRPRKALVARKCSYKEFMSCQPINFKDRFNLKKEFVLTGFPAEALILSNDPSIKISSYSAFSHLRNVSKQNSTV